MKQLKPLLLLLAGLIIVFLVVNTKNMSNITFGRQAYFNDTTKKIQIVSYMVGGFNTLGIPVSDEQYFLVRHFNRNNLEKSLSELENFMDNFIDTNTIKNKYKKFVFIEYSRYVDIMFPNGINNSNVITLIPIVDSYNLNEYTNDCWSKGSSVIYYQFGNKGQLFINSTDEVPEGYILCSLSNRIGEFEYSRTIKYIKRDFKLKENR